MKKYIENLKQKSYAEKSNFAFVTSVIITGLIAAVWFLTIFASPDSYFKPNNEAQNLANSGSLFDVFKEGLK
ncbi:MAG: hypothetical protein RLY49_110 [Candidatus Parcubacteria bacterium]|jgi:hypothetical protein